jgi:putative hemolysin
LDTAESLSISARLSTPARLSTDIARAGSYVARIASDSSELDAIFRLRFKVFNLEMQEGLDSAFVTGRDHDEYDPVCDHIFVQNSASGEIVGTYRMQTGFTARRWLGFYSEREFDFAPYHRFESQLLELGRACIASEHRSYEVLMLLWKAVAIHACQNGVRYLIGCSSVPTQDAREAWSLYRRLSPAFEVSSELRTTPTSRFAIPVDEGNSDARIPKLLRAYLAVGAKICGPPALDQEFKTVDFLTLLDLEEMSPVAKARFLK